jgi:hypothetical protein
VVRAAGVKVPVAIAAQNHAPRRKFLDRKTESVKLKGNVIIVSELANRK